MLEIIDKGTGEITVLDGEAEVDYKQEKLQAWHAALQAAEYGKSLVEAEQMLRKEVAGLFFPAPAEGTNNLELTAGWKLKLTHKIDRKVDEAALPGVQQQLRDMGVNPDTLISMKPSLETKAYKGLKQINADAAKVFEQALIIKPASPTLELVPPKAPKE